MEGNDRVVSVKVKRSAPCGSTFYVAENIRGVPLDEVDVAAGEKFHNYPCLASMEVDPRFGDTHLHVAGYLTREAFKRAAGCRVPMQRLIRRSAGELNADSYAWMSAPS